MNIIVISVSASALKLLAALAPDWPELRLSLHYVGGVDFSEEQRSGVIADLQDQDLILLDLMGAPQEFCRAIEGRLQNHPGQTAVLNSSLPGLRSLTRLGRFSLKAMGRRAEKDHPPDMARMQAMAARAEKLGRRLPLGPLRDMRNYFWLVKYWLFANPENITNLLRLLYRDYLGRKDRPKPAPPRTLDELTLYHPGLGRAYASWAEYLADHPLKPGLPVVGLLFYNSNYPVDAHPAVARLMQAWGHDFNLAPMAAGRIMGDDLERFKALIDSMNPPLEALVNLLSFRLGAGPMGGEPDQAVALLEELGSPLFHPFFLTKQTTDQWRSQLRGANPGEFLISMFLPELDGAVETAVLGAMGRSGEDGGELSLIPERVANYAQRVKGWLRLQRKSNFEKRAALIFYDYPPGEANLGAAAFLDVFESLAAILKRMKVEGYDLEPLSADQLRECFLGQGMLNTPRWKPVDGGGCPPLADRAAYQRWTAGARVAQAVDQAWGEFPGPVMAWQGRSVLPGLRTGKVFIGLQPSRGDFEDPAQSYHDKNLPPHHQYLAFYKWLEHEFQADAVIHLGTHGTLEFLPGKETALSGDCCPDYLVGGLPHLYVYYAGNPAEAMIAKRRAMAVMISHLSPPYTQAGSHGRLSELEELLSESEEAERLDPGRLPMIVERLEEASRELGWEYEGRRKLAQRLHEWRTSLIPGRLHVAGQAFSRSETLDFLVQLCQAGQGAWTGLPAFLGLSDLGDGASGAGRVAKWISDYVLDGRPLPPEMDAPPGRDLVRLGRELAAGLMNNRELDALMDGLAGRYIPAGLGGDHFRNPEVLPTGRNLYQFDPRRVPSPSAVERGRAMARNTLRAWGDGRSYPASVAVVLWGLETAKTQGETTAQILAYLGLELERDPTLWEPRLKVIPLDRLGRPRVDVVVQMCGFFRDMFPNLVELLAEAFELVAGLDEPEGMNYVKANALALEQELREAGQAPARARELSRARIFGPAASQYGTSLTNLVKAKTWQTEGDLASAYMGSLCHVYTKSDYGRKMPALLRGNLRRVELVSQVRSSMDYEITDLDHYYEFLGGLSRSVLEASGRRARVMVSDSVTGRVRTENLREAIQRGAGTRLLNPKWLGAMLAHKHHGGQQIADRLENLVGLAAAAGEVDNAIFERLMDDLILDEKRRRQIAENNPYALMEVMERLLEAASRGYWEVAQDRLEQLKDAYLQIEADLEENSEKWIDNS